MKKLLISLSLVLISSFAFGQSLSVTELQKIIQTSKELKPVVGKYVKPVLNNNDDCTPPPCTGLIDPWTCECYPDLKDPWENEVIENRMKKSLSFEQVLLQGKGGKTLPASMVKTARKRYPGNSLKAIVNRLNYYNKQVQ